MVWILKESRCSAPVGVVYLRILTVSDHSSSALARMVAYRSGTLLVRSCVDKIRWQDVES